MAGSDLRPLTNIPHMVSTVEDIVENGGVRTAMLDVSFACHMPDCLEMPYKPAILGARHTFYQDLEVV